MLVAFFEKHLELGPNHKYLYREFPEHFTWDGKEKEWRERTKGKAVGRIAYTTPSEGEKFYLRLLLANIRGPTSFTDLLTTNGKLCTSFQEVATEHGFLKSNNIFEICMEEALESKLYLHYVAYLLHF